MATIIKCAIDGEPCNLSGGRCRHLKDWSGKCTSRQKEKVRRKIPEPKSRPWIREPEEL
jgi:hypothetical protein